MSKRRRQSAPAPAGALERASLSVEADAAEAALAQFARDWAALEARLPGWCRVRMEGVDPGALPLRQALRTAVGYLTKWARCSFQCPSTVEAHFQAHRQVLAALASCASAGGSGSASGGVCLGLAGDCMWMRDTWTAWPGAGVQEVLASVDALVANLETPLHSAPPTDPAWVLQSYLPDMVTYSSPVAFLHAFRRRPNQRSSPAAPLVGAFSVANNHSADMGHHGARDTLAALDAEGIPHSGMRRSGDCTWCMFSRRVGGNDGGGGIARAVSPGRRARAQKKAPASPPPPPPPPSSLAVRCVNVGVYAATWGVNFPPKMCDCTAAGITIQEVPGLTSAPPSAAGVDLTEATAALRDMASRGCGLRIVSIHWGHEFEGYPTVCQMRVARRLVAAGADIVLGAHSHTQQPAEVLLVNGYDGATPAEAAALKGVPQWCRLQGVDGPPRKALVLYGMGNFCSTMFNEICRVGLLMTLRVSPPPSDDDDGDDNGAASAGRSRPWSWSLPAWHWLYNDAAVVRGATWARWTPRRLIHVASDGGATADGGGGATCPPEAATLAVRKRKLVDFVRCHVTGGGPHGQQARAVAPEGKAPPAMWL